MQDFLSKSAVTKIQAIIAIVILVAVIAGTTVWYLTLPSSPSDLDTLVVGTTATVDILDGTQGYSWPTYFVLSSVTDSLMQWKLPETVELAPMMATEWNMSDDVKMLDVTLRTDMKWHDGTPITAEDVKDHYQRCIDNVQEAYFFEGMDHMEVLETYKLRFVLKEPDATFPVMLAAGGHSFILSAKAAEESGDDFGKSVVIGSGPFKFVEWIKGDRIVLERNEEYWGAKPKLKKIIFKLMADPTTAKLALESGEIDMFYQYPQSTDIPVMKANSDLNWQAEQTGYHRFIVFNQNVPPFDNKLVRQAISYAINLTRIFEMGYKSDGVISYSMIDNSIVPYYKPVFDKYLCDPEKAKELLTQAGFADGLSFDFYYTPTKWDANDGAAALLIKDDLEQVGITCTVKMVEWAAFKEIQDDVIGMATKGWIQDYPDPDDVMHMVISWQSTSLNWEDSERDRFDQVGLEAKGTVDPLTRETYYDEAQEILAEECPIYPIKCSNRWVFYRTWVKDFVIYPNVYADDISFRNCYIEPH